MEYVIAGGVLETYKVLQEINEKFMNDQTKVIYNLAVIRKLDELAKDKSMNREEYLRRVKNQILEELKLFRISREILFSDNIDIICEEIVNTKRRKIESDFLY